MYYRVLGEKVCHLRAKENHEGMEPGSVDQIVIKALETQLGVLQEDYEATHKQLNRTYDASGQNRLKRQLEDIEEDMKSVEQELNQRRQEQKGQAIQALLNLLAILDHSVLTKPYRACLRDEDLDWLDVEPETAQAILFNLQQIRDRASGCSAVAEFLIHLIADTAVPPSSINALMNWGEEHLEKFLGVLKQARRLRSRVKANQNLTWCWSFVAAVRG